MESNEVNSSFFPPPPSRYLAFTSRNTLLAQKLQASSPVDQDEGFDASVQRQTLLKLPPDETFTPPDDKELEELQNLNLRTLIVPPKLEWLRERGGWTAFGDWEPWPGMAPRATLEGMPKLYEDGMGMSLSFSDSILSSPSFKVMVRARRQAKHDEKETSLTRSWCDDVRWYQNARMLCRHY